MHRPSLVSFACCAALGLAASAAQAADNDITTSFSGYGTVAGTMSSNHNYAYAESPAQFKGASDQLDIGGSSRLGLQGTVNFGPQFSVTAQALASRVGSKDFDINTEWLFGQYEPVTGLDFRLGRVVLPAFLFSDTRNVGYAQTWLRAPNEVYGVLPLKTLDGAQASWRKELGPVTLTSQVTYGKASADINLSGAAIVSADARKVVNVAFTGEYGNWTARVSQTRSDLSGLVPSFIVKDNFLSAGLQYDNGTALVLGEWARRSENDYAPLGGPLAASTSWYVAAGWRIDKFTPMVRYAMIRATGDSAIKYADKGTPGVVLRYEAVRNVALKAQIDRYDAANGPAFVSPASAKGTAVNVYSVGADFVF